MALGNIVRIDADTISVDGFHLSATPEQEETLQGLTKEARYEYIKKLIGQD